MQILPLQKLISKLIQYVMIDIIAAADCDCDRDAVNTKLYTL